MRKCLVTKLEESVNNDNLPFLNSIMFKLNVTNGTSYDFSAQTSSTQLTSRAYIVGPATWNNNGTKEIDIDWYATIYGKNWSFTANSDGEVIIKIKNREYIDGFSFDGCKSNITEVRTEDFNYPEINNLAIFNYVDAATVLIDNLKDATGLQDLRCSYSYMGGNIESLVKCINLISLNIEYYTRIEGEITTLASGMVSNERTSGTLCIVCNGKIMLNGTVVANNVKKYIKFGTGLPSGSEYTGTGYAIYSTNPDA